MMRAKDLLALSNKPPSLVTADAALTAVVDELISDRRTREVYVVDEESRLVGLLTLRRLAHFVFAQKTAGPRSAIDLLELFSAETAGHLAVKAPHVRASDSLDQVIQAMFEADVDELAVVDDDGVIVGCLDLLDILAAWRQGRLELAP